MTKKNKKQIEKDMNADMENEIPGACPYCEAEDALGTLPGGSWWLPEDKSGSIQCRHCSRFHVVRPDTRTNEEILRDWLEGECNSGSVSITRIKVYHFISSGEYIQLPAGDSSKLHEGPIKIPRDIGKVVEHCMMLVKKNSEHRSNKNIYKITTERSVPVTIDHGLIKMVPWIRSKHISLMATVDHEEVESLPRPSFRERMGSAAGSSTKRRVKTRTVERTWSRLSEAQRIVLDASAPSSHTGDGRLFKRGRLRTARSVQDRGLLVERGPNRFTRTAYGQKVIDWKNSNEHR